MQDNLTIDIHYNKLLDWLLSRRHCKQDWRDHTLIIREKINNAIQDMPATEELTNLLHGTYINYFHCLRIVQLLKETEASTKNIFGGYSSKRMKDWQEIVRLYQKDDIYLAEAAQLLGRNVSYDVPALKKQISKCKQAQTDSTRKQSEYSSLEAETKEKFQKKCKQMGIKGETIKSELLSLVEHLPQELDEISTATSKLTDALNYYTNFRQFVLEGRTADDDGDVSMLRYVYNKGNTTVYEHTHGRKPEKIVLPKTEIPEETDQQAENDIDWGCDLDVSEQVSDNLKDIVEGGIDFGESEAANIDWSDVDSSLDIQIEDGGVTKEDSSVTTAVVDDVGVASGDMALSVLENVQTRTRFVNDLYELDAFLMMRASELDHTGDVITVAIFDSAPSCVQLDATCVARMRTNTQAIMKRLNETKMQMMLSIRASTRYVDKLSETISSIKNQAEKFAAMQRLMVNKRNEALQKQEELEPKLDLIRAKTLIVKRQIEEEISKKYKNRPVNIMGEINVM